MKFIKMYIWAIRASYDFMQGSRNFIFWLKLPFISFWIAYKSI